MAVVEVREELVAHTADLVMQLGRGRAPCWAGLQFGTRHPGTPSETVVYDFLPDEQLREVQNLGDFCGMLVFDKRTCNTNGRQAILFRAAGDANYRALDDRQRSSFPCRRVEFSGCAAAGNLCAASRVRGRARDGGIRALALAGPRRRIGEAAVEEAASEIPPEWYEDKADALEKMLEQLLRRRKLVADLIVAAKKSSAQPFPNWK